MTEPTISCPNCKTDIRLTESLAAPLIAETRQRYEQALAAKDQAIAVREAAIRTQKSDLERDKAAFDEKIAEKLAAERARIVAEESEKAKCRAAEDLEAKGRELADLKGILDDQNKKLVHAQKAQAEFMRKERELEDARREMDLTIEKQVQSALGGVREKAKHEAEEALKLRVTEKEEQIAGMQRQIEELKRRAEQGSQQLQGEVMELELETLLRSKFPRDIIEPVPKGEFGGDIVQRVMGPSEQPCGVILWEFKRTKNWSDGWLTKLRDDQRKAHAELALIISNVMPKGVQAFDRVDGVWVAEFRCAIPVAIALRQSLIDLAAARQAGQGQQSKMELVYQYLTSPQFRHRIEAIVERISEMQADLDRERKAMTRLWAKREVQIRGVIESTAGMYGDLQGIAGRALEEIDGFDFPAIEDKRDSEEAAAAE